MSLSLKKIKIITFFLLSYSSYAQNLEYKVFYYENGNKSSEGTLSNGIPSGFWKNYYENGKLKSEGYRVNNLSDSIWKFYNDQEILTAEINYKNGKKHGLEVKYSKDGLLVSKENFVDSKREGFSFYYSDGKLFKKAFFKEDKETGSAYEYGKEGKVNSILNYNQGFIKTRDNINRVSKEGKKTGKWVEFYDCPEPCLQAYKIKSEGRYENGLKNGYFKEYDHNGDVLSVVRYVDGEIVIDEETQKIELQTEYYPNAKVKSIKGYKNGVLEGISSEFAEDGTRTKSEVYKNGNLIAQGGTIDESGLKQGDWKEFYADGSLRAQGKYLDGSRIGEWSFFYKNGKPEQKGTYKKGELASGEWNWFYENGNIKRTETFKNGLEEGDMIEYGDTGNIIAKGSFIEGEKEGIWFFEQGDYREEGEYMANERTGEWKHYYVNTNNLSFKGNYSDGIPEDKHTWYYPNGKRMLEGKYVSGLRNGTWLRYDQLGQLMMSIEYVDGNEMKINGVKIKPQNTDDFDSSKYKAYESDK